MSSSSAYDHAAVTVDITAVISINTPPKPDCCVVWGNRSPNWAPMVQGPGHVWLFRQRWVSWGLWRDWWRINHSVL